ncbi:MAG: GNAT family N-acetyltransferase [Candidatus Omnitrophota bacterium]
MEIKKCTQEFWDAFVDASPQGTVFNKSFALSSDGLPTDYLICYKGEEAIAGFGFAYSHEGIKLAPFGVWSGIIFKDLREHTPYRLNETVFLALEAFANHLFEHYKEVNFPNHWDIVDMRPFDWVNYHTREKGYFQITTRYTSLLDISQPQNTDGYARLRIRELRKGTDEGYQFSTKETNDIPLLDHLHEMNFKRQGIERSPEEAKSLISTCENFLKVKAGKLLATYVNEEPAVISFFAYDRHRAYHLIMGTDLKFRELGVGTKNFHDSCVFLNQQLGCKELDLVGVNSPLRAAYKLSYGGRIVPYFQVKKIGPKI